MVGGVFAQIEPYISAGANISLNNNGNGIFKNNNGRWGYEITSGIYSVEKLFHLKMSYGKKYFKDSTKFINYYTFGGGLLCVGYEKGFAYLVDTKNHTHKGKRSNIYLGGVLSPIDGSGPGFIPTNFYSREKFIFADTTYLNHNIWQKIAFPKKFFDSI